MIKNLPSRPNLDHLRRQAKSLLAALADGDAEAVGTLREHLPAARKMSPAQVRTAGFRLADAQSAIARKSGFEAWPRLARHVEQLRALEGVWEFVCLTVDGAQVPAEAISASRLLIDGDRFRMESPEATYEGVFNIDVEPEPHEIDIQFVQGPEAGSTTKGIFRVSGDEVEFCLDMRAGGRPAEFRAAPGSGHACETLRRTSGSRPPAVTGGTPSASASDPHGAALADHGLPAGFDTPDSPTLRRLQGGWSATRIVRDGKELPPFMLKGARREARGNDLRIIVGGNLIIHAAVRIDENHAPMHVDYYNLCGTATGTIQLGIMEWRGDVARFCMSAPGDARPDTFEAPAGSGRTLSEWQQP